jgi:hypothetical protein
VSDHPDLVATGVRYGSQGDEDVFFHWLARIGCVGEPWGRVRDLYIPIVSDPTDDELRELIALFHRYAVDLRQLATFETRANRAWFRKPEAYWHEGVFGEGAQR